MTIRTLYVTAGGNATCQMQTPSSLLRAVAISFAASPTNDSPVYVAVSRTSDFTIPTAPSGNQETDQFLAMAVGYSCLAGFVPAAKEQFISFRTPVPINRQIYVHIMCTGGNAVTTAVTLYFD